MVGREIGSSVWCQSRRRFLGGVVALCSMPFLTGCSLFAKPVPQPPAPMPTPTPTATMTPAAVRLGTPDTPATPRPVGPAPTILPALRGVGQFLYTTQLNGAPGIVLATGGSERRVLVRGEYEWPTWASDSTRFAAIGLPNAIAPTQQVALFAADGRALARFPVRLSLDLVRTLRWSPDTRHLLYLVRDPVNNAVAVWIAGEDGQHELPLDRGASLWDWTPGGRLAYITAPDGNTPVSEAAPLTVWTVDVQGNGARKVAEGAFWPLAFSPGGTKLFVAGGLLRSRRPDGGEGVWPTAITVLDLLDGTERTLVDVAAAPGERQRWLYSGEVAPDGRHLALWRGVVAAGSPIGGAGTTIDLVVVDDTGREVAADIPRQGAGGTSPLVWSPDSRRVAYHTFGPGGVELRVLALERPTPLAYPIQPADSRGGAIVAAWSADSRWLAYVDAAPHGLTIASAGEPRAYPFDPTGNFPAWRPVR